MAKRNNTVNGGRKKQQKTIRPPRKLQDEMITDLVGRLTEHLKMVETVAWVSEPHGKLMMAAYHERAAFCLHLEAMQSSMRDILRLAYTLEGDRAATGKFLVGLPIHTLPRRIA